MENRQTRSRRGLSRVARKLLERGGVDVSDVVPTGPDGAITDDDVMAAVRAVEEPRPDLEPVADADMGSAGSDDATEGPDSTKSGRVDGDPTMSKQEQLSRVISEMRQSIPELHGVMIASNDGLSIAHDFPESESEKIAAMAATALGLGQRITERANLGGLQEAVVRGDYGYLVVYGAGESAVLVLSGPSNSNLGLMRIEARAASAEISQVLR